LSWVYEVPKLFSGYALASRLFGGWQINGSYLAQSGQPVTAISGKDANGDFDGAGDRAILNPSGTSLTGTTVNYVLRDPETGFTSILNSIAPDGSQNRQVVGYVAKNPAARFVVAMPGTPDDSRRVGRNTIRTLGLNNWNFSVSKNLALRENRILQYRVEFYNAFNHRQYSLGLPSYRHSYDNALSSTYANASSLQFLDAGQFSGGNRSIQMSLKLVF